MVSRNSILFQPISFLRVQLETKIWCSNCGSVSFPILMEECADKQSYSHSKSRDLRFRDATSSQQNNIWNGELIWVANIGDHYPIRCAKYFWNCIGCSSMFSWWLTMDHSNWAKNLQNHVYRIDVQDFHDLLMNTRIFYDKYLHFWRFGTHKKPKTRSKQAETAQLHVSSALGNSTSRFAPGSMRVWNQ